MIRTKAKRHCYAIHSDTYIHVWLSWVVQEYPPVVNTK